MTEQLVFDLAHRQALGAGDFLLAPCNRDAVGWLDRWPDWPAPALTIHGPAGSGKTHMAEVWRARSGARVVPIAEIAAHPLAAFDDGGNAWVIDDVSPGFPETAFLHFYNAVAERGGHLLVGERPVAVLVVGHSKGLWHVTAGGLVCRHCRRAPG